jgi:predicted transcriptional regulator
VDSKQNKRERYSSEYTMLSVLEYMCTDCLKRPVTKYHIITNVHNIKRQRGDRISHIMDTLEKKEFIRSMQTSDSIYYQVTDKGITAYIKWAKDFLDFVRLSEES